MRILQRASFGYLLRHPVQLFLALLGIATGVAVIVAVDLANGSANTAFRLSVEALTGTASHQIVGGPGGVDDSLYTELRVEHGVTAIAPVVVGYAEYADTNLQVLGVDPFAEREFREYVARSAAGDQVSLRRLLTLPGAVLLAEERALEWGLAEGDTFTITVDGVKQTALVAGVINAPGRTTEIRDLLITDIATAQSWLALDGGLTRIDVRRDSAEELEQLRSLLPPGVQLLSAAGRTESLAQMSKAFTVNLTAMSLLALLVGVFLIFNSVSFAVVQRRSLIGILRALGLTRSGLFALIIAEALLLGIAGALLGLLAGIWLGETLLQLVSQSLNDLYFRESVTELVVSPSSLMKGVAAGLIATLLAAGLPALEAISYTPRLAIQRVSLEQRSNKMLWKLALAGLVLSAAILPLLRYSEQNLVAGLTALFMAILGIALFIPLLTRFVLTLVAGLVGLVGGRLPRLAVNGISANLSRTGVAIVALSVAVSATAGVSIMVDSFRLSVSHWIDQSLQADLYVAPQRGSFKTELARDIRRMAGIADSSSSRRVWLETESGRTRMIVLDMAPRSYSGVELIDTVSEDIWPAFDDEGAILISESFGYRRELGAGDVVQLPTDRGERAFLIGGVYRSYDAQAEAIIMSNTIYRLFWSDDSLDTIGLYLDDTAESQAVVSELNELAKGRQALNVRSNRELRELSLAVFDRTFLITNVLYWLAVCVAVVGILAALLAFQMERSRELATLRALGVTRLQLGGMVITQSGIIGVLSGLFALPMGFIMARLLIDVINRRAFGWSMGIDVNDSVVAATLLLATAAALIAGIYPAWRAGQSQPAVAMRED